MFLFSIRERSFLISVLILLSTANSSGSPGGDETDLATGARSALHRRRLADVLMVSTTVRMLDGVHGHTAYLRPAVALGLVLVVGASGLQHGLVDPATAGDDADHGAIRRRNHLLRARRQLDARTLRVGVVADDGGVVAAGARQLAAVARLLLEVGDDGALGHGADGHDVTDGQVRLLAAVDELAGVHALAGDHQLLTDLVSVRIPEVDDGERRAATRVVDDVADDALDVAVAFAVVDGAEPRGALPVLRMRLEDGSGAFTLSSNNAAHVERYSRKRGKGSRKRATS